MQSITRNQYDYLNSFFNSLWCSYHHNSDFNGYHWAQILDGQLIPWNIQNVVSSLAKVRENNGYYLSTLLKQNNIILERKQ